MHLTKNETEKCVMARIVRQRKMHQHNFTLKEYGSWSDATRAAKKWINELLPKLPPKIYQKGQMTRRNRSGEVGVHRSLGIVRKKNGNIYECPRWIGKWPGCKFRGGISWMEKQFDHEGSFVLAVLSRRMETINRDQVLAKFEAIVDTKHYDEIVAKMQM